MLSHLHQSIKYKYSTLYIMKEKGESNSTEKSLPTRFTSITLRVAKVQRSDTQCQSSVEAAFIHVISVKGK